MISSHTRFAGHSWVRLQYNILCEHSCYELKLGLKRMVFWFCSQFSTFNDYKIRGIGFAILHLGEFICGASSYTVYDEGIEIEIVTRQKYRHRGLAVICASKLIIECIKRGLYPSWDAANLESVALSEKLGYHFDKEYITYEIDCNNHKEIYSID